MAEKYEWKCGHDYPVIDCHSRVKHNILEIYLTHYVEVLTSRIQQDALNLTLVDGFSGGGLYRDRVGNQELFGSPLIMLRTMREAAVKAQSFRTKKFTLSCDFVFVDSDYRALDFLKHAVDDCGYSEFRENIEFVEGAFVCVFGSILNKILDRGKRRRTIFVLDQYGYKDVPMYVLRRIFHSLPNAEVILTFAVDWLVDYLSDTRQSRSLIERIGLKWPLAGNVVGQAESSIEWRRLIQVALHRDIADASGAKHYTPFFIRSKEAHRDYWLVHLSNHPKARDVMTELHWENQNQFVHYGRSGLSMLGYNPALDFEEQGYAKTLFDFGPDASRDTIEALKRDIPSRIATFDNGVRFSDFFASIANETPATKKIIKKAIKDLAVDASINVLGSNRKLRRKGVNIDDGDIIKFDKTKRFFF